LKELPKGIHQKTLLLRHSRGTTAPDRSVMTSVIAAASCENELAEVCLVI
jgi:hypothetical protein